MITKLRLQHIAEVAHGLWASFSESNQIVARNLLIAPPRATVNPGVIAFSRHCAKQVAIDLSVMFSSTPMPKQFESDSNVAAWLFRCGSDQYAILIYRSVIADKLSPNDDLKAITRLILKQVGTLILDESLRGTPTQASESVQSPEQEEEAWIFCNMILGFAVGTMALSSRSKHIIDEAWSVA